MNESLLRDLHDTQIEEINKLKSAIAELVAKPTASPTDIAKVQLMLTNIKLPAQDYSELKRYFYDTITTATSYTKTQLVEFENVIKANQNSIAGTYKSINARLEEIKHRQDNPTPKVNIHKLDFKSFKSLFIMIGLFLACVCLSAYIFRLRGDNAILRANDLKYRYIKMVGNVDDALIYDIEELLYKDESGEILDKMEDQIKDYEKAVEDKIRAEEQARLRASEATELDKKIKSMKQKN